MPTATFRKPWTLALAASLASSAWAQGQPPAGITDALGQCYDRQAALVPFSGVVLARRGEESFFRTAGFMDPERKVPISRDARFRLASVQKVLTRTAVGLLVDQGRVRLDDPVGKYVQGLPAEIAAVTVDQLLQHRSGVASLTRLSPEIDQMLTNAKTARDLLPAVVREPLSFRPGERQQYSNGGYFLLGVLIEEVTGKTYDHYLEETIFRPLGMTSTGLVADARTAAPQSKMGPGMTTPLERRGTPAGNGVSSADDLMKLGEALTGDRLLPRATKERIYPRRGNEWRVGQSGGSLGTNTDLTVLPESGWVLVVLSNYDPPAGEVMAEALRGVISGHECKPLSEADRPSRLRMAPSRPDNISG